MLDLCKMVKKQSEAIQGNELRHPLHLSVVAIKKGAFWSPSTMVANFTLYVCIIF